MDGGPGGRWRVVWAGVAAVLLATPAVAAQDQDRRLYVALGDSYSSGEGVTPFVDGTDSEENPCHRSTRSYPALFATSPAGKRYRTLSFACAGATTEDFFAGGRSADTPDGQVGTVPAGADLITVTIGGNDLGFGRVMAACTFGNCTTNRGYDDMPQRIEALRPKLRRVYEALRGRAAGARLVVLAYPRFLTNVERIRWCPNDAGLSPDEKDWLNGHLEHVNRVTRAEAEAAGATFVDVENAFAGHEVCTPDAWSIGIHDRHPSWSYHPNAKGHRAMVGALERAVT
jgi:lysophospholipase L1-like esterase